MAGRQMNRIVAIDCMVLVYGVRRGGNPDQVERARILFDELERDDATIIVPAVVVAEYITPIPTEKERERTAIALAKRFQIEPFDLRDTILAARLWNEGRATRAKAKPNVRTCLRADTLIVATAAVRGASEFYTEDAACAELARRAGMRPRKLPTIGPLFSQEA